MKDAPKYLVSKKLMNRLEELIEDLESIFLDIFSNYELREEEE